MDKAYVALSRAKTLSGLFLHKFEKGKLKCSKLVKAEMKRLRQLPVTICQFQTILHPPTKHRLSIALLNARSARLHLQDIKQHPLIQRADIICLTETHFISNERDTMKLQAMIL